MGKTHKDTKLRDDPRWAEKRIAQIMRLNKAAAKSTLRFGPMGCKI